MAAPRMVAPRMAGPTPAAPPPPPGSKPTSPRSPTGAAAAPANAAVMEEKKRAAAKVVTTLFPRIPKVTTLLLDFFVKREDVMNVSREPLSHFCQEEVVLAAQDLLDKLNRQVITYQDIRDTAENMIGLHNLVYKKSPEIAKELGDNVRKLIVIIGELAISLEKVSDVPPTDWMGIGDTVVAKTEKLNLAEIEPFWSYIPKVKDFQSIKLLGAGGFGAVYKAVYKPTNLVVTLKLVPTDKFRLHKQACVDKVTASVIRNPFLVKYYTVFCTRDAYLTVMEYICGADLFRVVDKAVYLPTNECRIVMAQLILALEHMHLRGLLHRDIKVSNMMIIPGGRVKVIDFDTNKVCIGHSISATANTKKRNLYKVGDMVDVDPASQEALYTYASPSFKKMISYAKKSAGPVTVKSSFFDTSGAESPGVDYKNASDTDVVAGIRAYSGTGASADKSITAKERQDVLLFRTKYLGKYWSFGISIAEVQGENNRRFFMVDKVKNGSPAQVSHVLEGDFIVAVNGQDVGQLPIAEVRRRMQDSGDQLVLTVLSSSPFRMLESRRDMDEVLKAAGTDTIQLRAIQTTCGGSGNYGFTAFEAKAWNEKKKALVHCHIIQKLTNVQIVTPKKFIYPGDVLLMINGQAVDTMDQYGVKSMLARGANEISITIAPMSPLRLKRPSYTRLHETVMTDQNVPEPSGKAVIVPPPKPS
ncbi:uncharacterized protein LOC142772156 isoform X2 [Rhipicephalus microplus]|uniref:uncharacterized protein LOC142772156 isoform X2 n=1 Tax=Rhipicephalus microplus TaxID=6941 RepID=UPI003F6B2381